MKYLKLKKRVKKTPYTRKKSQQKYKQFKRGGVLYNGVTCNHSGTGSSQGSTEFPDFPPFCPTASAGPT